MILSMIVAMGRNRVIGSEGSMPWRLPRDLKYFKETTMGKPVVMGRKTYESIGRPLPGRRTIVMTRKQGYEAPGCTVVHSIEEALLATCEAREVMIAGGADVYRQFLPLTHRIYLTCIDANFDGDATFPELSEGAWQTVWEEAHQADARNPYNFRFLLLERNKEAAAESPQPNSY